MQGNNTTMEHDDVFSRAVFKYDAWMAMGDARTEEWPLVASPVPCLMISAIYVLLATRLPKVLKGRAFPVYYPVILYNFLVVLLAVAFASQESPAPIEIAFDGGLVGW